MASFLPVSPLGSPSPWWPWALGGREGGGEGRRKGGWCSSDHRMSFGFQSRLSWRRSEEVSFFRERPPVSPDPGTWGTPSLAHAHIGLGLQASVPQGGRWKDGEEHEPGPRNQKGIWSRRAGGGSGRAAPGLVPSGQRRGWDLEASELPLPLPQGHAALGGLGEGHWAGGGFLLLLVTLQGAAGSCGALGGGLPALETFWAQTGAGGRTALQAWGPRDPMAGLSHGRSSRVPSDPTCSPPVL